MVQTNFAVVEVLEQLMLEYADLNKKTVATLQNIFYQTVSKS